MGALVFQTPCSENVRASVWGPAVRDRVTELHWLVILDCTPKNTESWSIATCLREPRRARHDLHGVLSFADPSQGQAGTISMASNAASSGLTKTRRARDREQTGRLRHRRQCGRNISAAEASARGWTTVPVPGKHRYCLMLPDGRSDRRPLLERLVLENRPYPRPPSTSNGGI